MIRVKNLVKTFGRRRAVDGVSFDVKKGTVLGFLGPNGAGKTTTIRMIAGYLTPNSGSIEVNGINVITDRVKAQKGIGYMPENTPLYEDMTVETFLAFAAEIRGFTGDEKKEKVQKVIDKCMLKPVQHQAIDTLSKGYRQRTCFAQALLHDPEVLLLDEPTEGLDPNQKKVVRDMICDMAKDKIIMLSTHVLEEVEAICSRVIIISNGQVVADSTPADLKKQSDTYNNLTLELLAPLDKAKTAFEKIPDVESVETIDTSDKKQTLYLRSKGKQPLAVTVLEAAAQNKWMITDMQTDHGRLDDVFRHITTTEDVINKK